MGNYVESWGKVYNKSILSWTGKKKLPKGAAPAKDVDFVTEKARSVVQALSAIDKITLNRQSKTFDKDFTAYCKQREELRTVAKQYFIVIDNAIKKADKTTYPEVYRDLNVLRKHLESLVDSVASIITQYSKVQEQIEAPITKKLEEAKSQNAPKQELDFLKSQRLLLSFEVNAKSALSKCLAAVQKIKADPVPAVYNSTIGGGGTGDSGAGRALSTQFRNVIKLLSDPKCPTSLKEAIKGLDAYDAALIAFGDPQKGDKSVLDKNTIPAVVLQRVKEFSELTKAMMPYYSTIVKYLGENDL